MLSLQKKKMFFLSFHSPTFHSKIREPQGTFFEREELPKMNIHVPPLHVEPTETNKSGVKNWEFRENVLSECPLNILINKQIKM